MRSLPIVNKTLVVAVAMAFAIAPSVPAAAQGGSSIWGVVPDSMRADTTQVVNERIGGERVSGISAPADGRFGFGNLAAGDYVVRLVDAAGGTIAQSQVVRVQPDVAVEAVFTDSRIPAAAVFGGAAGSSKALLLIGGAALVGLGTVIVLSAGDDEPQPASPSR